MHTIITLLTSHSIVFFVCGVITGVCWYAHREARLDVARMRREMGVAEKLPAVGGPAEPVLIPASPDDMVLIRRLAQDEARRY